ncbi:MBL fold metallo-hydrolase [Metabacillus sp. Hm71]|uniref:MBL fold metallo-hydrolase n=1 Tax=Metabacillus sp. Hm71 TaxID=3450743 RepID=UPI003F444D1C
MKIKALGVNGAFTKYYHNNFVFELGTRKFLVDAGTTLRYSLHAAGYKETDITDVIITHLHSDHVGGLEEFAQRCKWIYNHNPTLWIRAELADDLADVISYGLCTDGLKIGDYFDIKFVHEDAFEIENHSIELIVTDGLHAQGMKSMGLKITAPSGQNIIYTSDIAKHEEAEFKEKIDENTAALFHDVSIVKNAVHSELTDVINHYKDVLETYRIYAMHYQDDTNIKTLEKECGINFVVAREEYEIG